MRALINGIALTIVALGTVGADPASDLELATRFSPILVLTEHPSDPSIKVLQPEPVEIVGAQSSQNMWFEAVSNGTGSVTDIYQYFNWDGPIDYPGVELAQNRFAFLPELFSYSGKPPGLGSGSYQLKPHWDYPGDDSASWDAAYFGGGPQAGANFPNTAYVHIFERPGWPGYAGPVTVLQYYYFYPYNDFTNNHEGDWPRLHVVVSSRDPQTATVLGVEYLFHGKVLSYFDHYDPEPLYTVTDRPGFDPRTEMHLVDGTHPVAYVSAGGHGSYPTPGTYDLEFEVPGTGTNVSVKEKMTALGLVLGAEVDDSQPGLAQSYDLVLLPEPDPAQPNMGLPPEMSWLGANVKWGQIQVDSPPFTDNDAARGPYHHGWGQIKLFDGGQPAFAHGDIPYSQFHHLPIVGDVTWSGQVVLHGDVVVYPGARLTLAPGTTVEVRLGDIHKFVDGDEGIGALAEIFVYGAFEAVGAEGQEVILRSGEAPSYPVAWGGIRVQGGGSAVLRDVVIQNAAEAVFVAPGGAVDWGTDAERASRIENSNIGVHARGLSFATVQNVDFDEVHMGVWLEDCHSVTAKNLGIRRAFDSGDKSIWVQGGSGNVVANNSITATQIVNNSIGIALENTTLPLVYNNAIGSVGIGIYGANANNADIRHNNIADVGLTELSGVGCQGCTFLPPRYTPGTLELAADSPLINLGIEPPAAKAAATLQSNPPDIGRFSGTDKDQIEGTVAVFFSQVFIDDAQGFAPVAGNWVHVPSSQTYDQTQTGGVTRSTAAGPGSGTYYIEAKMKIQGAEGKLVFADAEHNEGYRVDLMNDADRVRLVIGASSWEYIEPSGIHANVWYKVGVRVRDQTASVYLDGQPLANLQNRAITGAPTRTWGLGTYSSFADFDAVYVLDEASGDGVQALFADDFGDGDAAGWGQEAGQWAVNNGQYYRAGGGDGFSTAGSTAWTDYTLEADLVGARDVGLLVRAQDYYNAIVLIVRPNHNDIYWHVRQYGSWGPQYNSAPLGFGPGADLHVQIDVQGDDFVASVNGQQKTAFNAAAFASGKIGAYAWGGVGQYQAFDNFVVSNGGGSGGFLVDDGFDDGGTGGWTAHGGQWAESGGLYQVSGLNGEAWSHLNAALGTSTYTLKTRLAFGGYEGKVLFHNAHLNSGTRVDLLGNADQVRVITPSALHSCSYPLEPNLYYVVEVEVDDAADRVNVWIDGNLCNSNVQMAATPDGYVGLGSYGPTHSTHFDYFQAKEGLRAAKPATDGPLIFGLGPNYPNPFNPETTIRYRVPASGQVSLEVFNALGQKVRHLVQGVQAAGDHSVVWDGRNEVGAAVASGTYLYRLQAPGFVETRKMTLVR